MFSNKNNKIFILLIQTDNYTVRSQDTVETDDNKFSRSRI